MRADDDPPHPVATRQIHSARHGQDTIGQHRHQWRRGYYVGVRADWACTICRRAATVIECAPAVLAADPSTRIPSSGVARPVSRPAAQG